MAYWLGFGGFTADALHSIPGQGTIPHAAQYRQNAKKKKIEWKHREVLGLSR